ncbi:MAG TPA: FAD-binding protein [Clostridiaceae bacterium]|nr:FAD-binding protein [Clostridiaceae bacterium]
MKKILTIALCFAMVLTLTLVYGDETAYSAAGSGDLTDGTYSVSAAGYSWMGMIYADVTIKDNALADFVVTEEHESYTGEVAQPAFDLMPERIIENQSLDTDAISGATVTSMAIKSCFAQAIEAAGGDSSEWYTEIEKKTDTVTLDGYDVIVVGMGGSGIMSYCAAADHGATVFGIETCAKLGGQSATTTGPMILGSKAEAFKDAQFPDMDEVYSTWIDYVGSEEKADIIYECVYNNGEYIDYFIDNFGFKFAGLIGSFEIAEWKELWTRYNSETRNVLGPNKTFQFDNAVAIAKAMNEKNDYMLELTADELIMDESGDVIGVHAVYYDGTEYEIYGDSVILATGGYIGNHEMVKTYLEGPTQTVAFTVSDGTGINMGISAGGATYMLAIDPMIHILQVPNMIRNDDLTPDQKAVLSAFALVADEKKVDINGKDLDPAITHYSDIPGYHYYVVYTQEQMDAFKAKGLTENFAGAMSFFLGQGGTIETGAPLEDLDEILEVGMKYNNIFKADSIAELAAIIGCDEAALSETLGGTETTYYAADCMSYAYATVGGLDVDVNMNVLREDGTPIENLYGVGQDSQGVCNVEGKPYTPWGGQAQAWTFVSGYLAGTSAAASFAD